MNEILERIRKPSVFILLVLINLWFFYTLVWGEKPALMYGLIIFFFFFSVDYNGFRREYLYWLLVFVAISIIDFNSHKLNVLTPLVLMQCASRMDLRRYLLYNIIIMGTTVVFMFVTMGTGNMSFGEGVDLVRYRYDFGLGHPNVAAMYYWGLFMTMILYCYLSKYRNFLWILISTLFLISLHIYSETVSRGFIAVIFVFIIVFGYYTVRSRYKKDYQIGYSRYLLYALPLLLTALTVYLSLNAEKYAVLDVLLSNRLSLYKSLLIGISPLEYLVGTSAFDRLTIDSSYLHLLFESGALLFVYFIWLYYFAIGNIIKQQNYIVITILVSFLVYGLVESLILLPMLIGNNLFWVLLYRYRYDEDEYLDISENKKIMK